MTTPWWTKKVFVRSIAVIVGILIVLVLFVQINHSYKLFSSEMPALQENDRLELSRADSLKDLVTTWLDGELNSYYFRFYQSSLACHGGWNANYFVK